MANKEAVIHASIFSGRGLNNPVFQKEFSEMQTNLNVVYYSKTCVKKNFYSR